MDEAVQGVLDAWRTAEAAGDVDGLAAVAADDFTLIGPFGFLLDREAWLERYRSGDLVTTGVTYEVDDARRYGPVWLVIGTTTMTATYRGGPAGGAFRSTHVVVTDDGRARLAGLQLSLRHPPQQRG
jgi:hypothetical protein